MNEERFTGRATLYAQYRPTYPEAAMDYLYTEIGFKNSSTIADIGAGTGIFSKLLAARGSSVVCIEPNADMLSAAQKELAAFGNCRFVSAPAERTTLADNAVDFVTVAQAFHWFDRNAFKDECRRILKIGGNVVLVWNTRDRAESVNIEHAEIDKRIGRNFKGFSGGSAKDPNEFNDFFKNGTCKYKTFTSELAFDEDRFIGRSLSSSYAPLKGSQAYDEYVREIKKLFARHSKNGVLTMANITKTYIGEV